MQLPDSNMTGSAQAAATWAAPQCSTTHNCLMATRQAVCRQWRQQRDRQHHSAAQCATARQQHDRQCAGGGSGGEAGSTTVQHDAQPPNSNTTGSAQAAVRQAAPQHGTTHNCPMVTQQAAVAR